MKCKYRNKCKCYDIYSDTCNIKPSDYCGKYREFKKKGYLIDI